MVIENIKKRLESQSILYSQDSINNKKSVIGYDKIFKWRWIATQLNTFIVAVDIGSEVVTEKLISQYIDESFNYAKSHYKGWPRGFQSGIAVITILVSDHINEDAIEYCKKLKSGKKWAAFTVPVIINSSTNESHYFEKKPIWGRIYFSYLKNMISGLL